MTRNLIKAASRTHLVLGSVARHRSDSRATLCVENLEHRLALSSASVGFAPAIVGNHIGTPAIVGNHIGTAAIQGNHIGTAAIQGNHIGTAAIQGNHIGTPADLNPQPLPPGIFHVEPMIVGEHVGS